MLATVNPALRRRNRLRCRAEPFGHSHQVGERIGFHLLHHFAPVGFHRNLADAQLPSNLFIQQAGDNQHHNLPFTTRK